MDRERLFTENGTNWTSVSSGLTTREAASLAVSGNTIFAGTQDGLFLSIDNGSRWTKRNVGPTGMSVLSLSVNGNLVFAGIRQNGFYFSTNNGSE
jgi:hypothetical protein